ncbi:hypothetical protein ABE485_08485 [Achromobacter spanius]|uniref:hypothetical protein n=1 Tax=Achromobacter spanius TaxID=217203 RepID=UPI00320B5052
MALSGWGGAPPQFKCVVPDVAVFNATAFNATAFNAYTRRAKQKPRKSFDFRGFLAEFSAALIIKPIQIALI